ncbi:MAG: dihydroorotase, partial [Bacteroidetes bacterium]
VLLRALQYMQAFGGLLIQHPQDDSIARQGQMNEGPASTRLGMPGIPELAEVLAVQQALGLLAYTGGRLHLQPLTSPEALAILARTQPGENLTTGIPAYYFAFSDEDLSAYDTHLKVMPPLRSTAQQAALRTALQAGQFDVLTSGHQAQGLEEKAVEFALASPGMLSLQTFFPVVNAHLIEPGVLSWGQFVQMVAIRPREILRQPAVHLAEGQPAELTLFHPESSWTLTARDIPSRAKNSPWIGQSLKGAVLGTYFNGQFYRQRMAVAGG